MLAIPTGTVFERFLAPVPAGLEYSTVGLGGPFSPTPPVNPADIRALRYGLGALAASQVVTQRVVLCEPGTPGAITDYFVEVVSQESPVASSFSGHLRSSRLPRAPLRDELPQHARPDHPLHRSLRGRGGA